MKTFFLILFLVVAGVHLVLCFLQNEKLRKITKPMLMSTLILYYLSAADPIAVLLLIALLTSLMGDILLIPTGEKWLTAGGVFFLASHVIYILLYYPGIVFSEVRWYIVIPVVVIYLLIAFLVIRLIKDTTPKSMLGGLYLYLVINTVMNTFALMQLMSLRNTGALLAFFGAICFFASDCILFVVRYYKNKEKLWKGAFLVMLSYLAAQFLITQGMLMNMGMR